MGGPQCWGQFCPLPLHMAKIVNSEALKWASAEGFFFKFSKDWGLFWTYLSDQRRKTDGGYECVTVR